MKTIKEKQSEYFQKPIDAIITNNTMIPGKNGKSINLNKSYNKMKAINNFEESLIVYNIIKPNRTIYNHFDKIIISGNQNINKVSVITEYNDKYCYTESITIKKDCILNRKYTILVDKITNNYLTNIKERLHNGKIFFIENDDHNTINLITKYIKNNNYELVSIDEIINEN